LNKWETHCIKKKTIQTTTKPTGWTMKRKRAKKREETEERREPPN